MKKPVDPSVYTKEYYLTSCLGFEEFNKSHGKKIPERTIKFLSNILFKPGIKILDIGCGRGDVVFYCSQKGAESYGIDYSKNGILLAKQTAKNYDKKFQKLMHFSVMDAKKLDFTDNFFDVVVSIDMFEHLYKEELEIAMTEISRVLKKNGQLLVHTEPNVIYLNFVHPFYIYPISEMLIKINKFLTKRSYPGFSKDPRNDLHKKQHVNEPTYFYLSGLFKKHHFNGKLISLVSTLKPILGWKDLLYNVFVLWYPLCLIPPFIYFFAYDYIALMINNKSEE